ncbi:MAG: malectin, partial [Planctomycetales bacterium]
ADSDDAINAVFDVKLQGKTVAERVNVVEEAGGPNRVLIREFSDVAVIGKLLVELVPRDGAPILSGVQIERQE